MMKEKINKNESLLTRLMGNRGSIFVEGAMVMPLILVLVFTSIYLLMDFYILIGDETRQDNAVFASGFMEADHVRQAAALETLI